MFYSHESGFTMPSNAEMANKHTSSHFARRGFGDRLVSDHQAIDLALHD